MESQGDRWRAQHPQTGLEVWVPWEQSAEGQKVSWGSTGGRAPLSGVSVGEEPLSWVHRRPWLRRETGLEKPQGTGKRGGSWPGALGTRNVRPQRPSTWDEDLVPGQCQLEETGLGHLALLITLGATVPPRRLKFG